MIDPRELRIGNYVYPAYSGNMKGDEIKVVANDIAKCEAGVYFLNPIPLTEEWLLRFKFEYDGVRMYHIHIGSNVFIYFNNALQYWLTYGKITEEHESVGLGKIKYVHQLQNLYFALTGEELTIANADPQQ